MYPDIIRRYWNYISIAILCLGAMVIWFTRLDPSMAANNQRPAPQQGFPAPNFTLQTLQGTELTLSNQRGNPVLVNLWASWCGPCRAEMPAMQEIYEKYREQGFTILAVNATNQDSRNAAADFVEEHQLTFPILLDTSGEVSDLYNLRSLPTSFFINADGIIEKVIIGGPMEVPTLEKNLKPLFQKGQ